MIDIEHEIGFFEAVNDNYDSAEFFLKISAENGNVESQNDLGVIYERKKQFVKALFWYEKAGKNGNPIALCNAGQLYMKGQGTKLNYEKAIQLYKKAIQMNCEFGYYLLGRMYAFGIGVEENDQIAARYWIKGSKISVCDRGCNLFCGYIYEYGIGVKKDEQKAFKYYQLATDQGNYGAKYYLGKCYLEGKGVAPDIEYGIKLCYESAFEGCSHAMFELAKIYGTDEYGKKNDKLCLYWLNLGVCQDDQNCLLKLAELAIKGEMISVDLNLAHQYLERFLELCPEENEEMMNKYYDLQKSLNNMQNIQNL